MPKLHEAALKDLHRTQLTVGMIVVREKRKHLAGMSAANRQAFMKDPPMPAVIGPKNKLCITDHHHLGRAALDVAVPTGFSLVEADEPTLGLLERPLAIRPENSLEKAGSTGGAR